MLVFAGNFEIAENQQKDEEVVDRQRFFDQVSGEELHTRFLAQAMGQKQVQSSGQTDPHTGPKKGVFHADIFVLAVHYRQIKNQHQQYGGVKVESTSYPV